MAFGALNGSGVSRLLVTLIVGVGKKRGQVYQAWPLHVEKQVYVRYGRKIKKPGDMRQAQLIKLPSTTNCGEATKLPEKIRTPLR